jgi:hypothetical protein
MRNPQIANPLEMVAYANPSMVNDPSRAGYMRSLSPEYLLGDGCIDPKHSVCDKSRRVAPYSANVAFPTRQLDYNTVGVIGQARAALELLYSGYANQGTRFPLTNGGTSATKTFNYDLDDASTVVESLGFVLDFGVGMLNFSPFDLQLSSAGFVNLSPQFIGSTVIDTSVDRSIVVRVNDFNGGSIFVPWAHRVSAPLGTMQDAIIQIGRPLPQTEGSPLSAIVCSNIPAALIASFSATVQFMTAGSPVTAAWAELIGAYRGMSDTDAAAA